MEEIEHNVVSGVREELKMTYNSIQEDYGCMNVHVCGGTGGWRRVVYLNMTDPNAPCPSGWQLSDYPRSKRACGRVNQHSHSCDSTFFLITGRAYSSVCGRIRGYQYSITTAFNQSNTQVATIEEAYVSGVSLTHGSPRQHIWTFAVGDSEHYSDRQACPWDYMTDVPVPSFVSEDYFCESGV